MKIAILGTRGIPNYHGGFEQFAEFLSRYLVSKEHEVVVYCSSLHPYQKSEWEGVKLIHKYDPEDKIGTAGQFIYDLNCILDSRNQNFDIILQLGYTSSSIWSFLFPQGSKIVTNMDGLEWKRSKYSSKVQSFLKFAERLAVKNSNALVSDSIGIQSYLKSKYQKTSTYIAYGVETDLKFDTSIFNDLELNQKDYDLLIARMEPENNIEIILDGVVASNSGRVFVVVGKVDNSFGAYLVDKYRSFSQIKFTGGIYDFFKLNALRAGCNLYFHGHSVGGTNPSLLEAIACKALVVGHKNEFNSAILGPNSLYFSSASDVQILLDSTNRIDFDSHVEVLYEMVVQQFAWSEINKAYLKLFHAVK